MDAVAPKLSDWIGLKPRYVRSINIERDLHDPNALDGYVLSDSPARALATILKAFRPGSTQRAVRVTGPYGAGKSALGLLLARLLCFPKETARAVRAEASELADVNLQKFGSFTPLIVTGRRAPLSQVLAEAIVRSFEAIKGRGRKPDVLRVAERVLKNPPALSDESVLVLEMFDGFCSYVERSSTKLNRVLLVIDELGRFLEYAAVSPNAVDPAAFQIIAERCAGRGQHACLALVHSGSTLVEPARDGLDDWWKVAERFEDIPLHGSTEQSLALLSRALVLEGTDKTVSEIQETENAMRSEAIRMSLFPRASTNLSFFPVHPTVLYSLSAASRKLRQNERSFFGFLQSGEAYGLQDFLASHTYGTHAWYRLPDLASYLLGVSDLNYGDEARRQRWELLRGIVEASSDLSTDEINVLKTVGLINLLDPLPLLRTIEETISFALGIDDVTDVVQPLVKKRKLHRRPDNSLCVWDSTLVDLSRLREDIQPTVNLDDFETAFQFTAGTLRPLVAQRHYHTTGTQRFFSIGFGKPSNAPSIATNLLNDSDGGILIVALGRRDPVDRVRRSLAKIKALNDPRLFIVISRLTSTQVAATQEILVWARALEEAQELHFDDLARDEVRHRLDQAMSTLGDWFTQTVGGEDPKNIVWLHEGRKITVDSRRKLQELLSDAADKAFNSAPIIKSELINRTQLSTAAAAARNRLVHHIFENADLDRLGIEGTPPEYAVYLSLFSASGIHRHHTDKWAFSSPSKDDPQGWIPSWQMVETLLDDGKPVAISNLVQRLGEWPYGLRRDVALLFLMAFLKANETDTVLLENALLVIQPNEAVFMRMVKALDAFALHRPPHVDTSVKAITKAAIKVATPERKAPSPTSFTDTARTLYQWYNRLPKFAQRTGTVSLAAQQVRAALERASDPVELFSEQLSDAVTTSVKKPPKNVGLALSKALEEIDGAYGGLLKRIVADIEEAFAPIGDISKIRRFVQEMEPFKGPLKDYRLVSIIERSTRCDFDDEAWAASIASSLTSIDPQNWTDPQTKTFNVEVRRAAEQLRSWHALARRYVSAGGKVSKFLSVFTIDMEGNEKAFSVPGEIASTGEANKVLERIRKLVCDRPDRDSILLQLLIENSSEKGNGGSKS